MVQRFMFAVNVILNREFKLHGILLLQTADSSWEFLKIKQREDKAAQNNSYGWKIAWNY